MDDNERIDKVLSELDKNKSGLVDVQKFLVNKVNDNDLRSYQRIIREIVNQEFAKQQSGLSTVCEILPAGREIVKAGGYIKYLERQKAEEEEENRLRKIKNKLDEVNLELNGFYLKYKWVPFFLSGFAILISIAAIIISIVKS